MTAAERVKRVVGSALGAVGSLALALVFGFFMLAQCVGDAKSFLSCVGLGATENTERATLREMRADDPGDTKMARSFVTMAQAAGLDPFSIGVVILVSDEVNALTFGEGTFVLFEGLSKVPDTVLDGIMAHEMAHALLGHSLRSADKANTIAQWTSALGVLAGVDEDGARQAVSWTLGVAMPSHSREQELEADRTAVSILQAGGYGTAAPSAMLNTLMWMRDNTEMTKSGFFSTHPSLEERIQHLRE
jgi:predicted Zn-dependent protease